MKVRPGRNKTLEMKTPRLAAWLAILVLAGSVVCAEEVKLTPKEASAIKSFDLHELQAQATVLNNELLKVKFNYRLPETELLDDSVLKGTIAFSATNVTTGVAKTGSMMVLVPKEGRAWFMKIPTLPSSRRPLYAFARLHIKENVPQLELLGRELKSTLKGPQIVWEQ
jgi:hypothetical protein